MSLVVHRVQLAHFRGVTDAEVSFATSGVTFVHAPNESGKSTVMEAIDLVLKTKSTSQAQSVRDVQPVGSDVGSFVELELTCGQYHMVLRKRFNKATMTELEITASEAEQLTGEQAHERMRQIVEANVDESLFSALWMRQGRPLTNLSIDDSSALATALDARAGGAGVDTDDALVDRIQAEFERYFTPTGIERQVLRDVDADVEQAQRELTEREDQLERAEADITALEELERTLAELKQRHDHAQQRRDELQEQLDGIERARNELRAAEAQAQNAKTQQDLAAEKLEQRTTLIREIDELTTRVEHLSADLQPGQEQQRELSEQLTQAEAALRQAADREKTATAEREQATGVENLLRKQDERRSLHDRAQAATDAAEKVASMQAALQSNQVTRDVLEEIRAARTERQSAQAVLQTGAPALTVTAHQDVSLSIDGDTVDVEAGSTHERSVDDHVALEASSGGTSYVSVEVRPGKSLTDLRADVEAADRRLTQALERAGVESLDAAEDAAENRGTTEQELQRAQSNLEDALGEETRDELLTNIDTVTAEVDELSRTWGQPTEEVTVAQATAATAEATAAENQRREEASTARHNRDQLRARLDDLHQRVADSHAEWKAKHDDLESRSERLQTARNSVSDDELQSAVEAARQECERLDEQQRLAHEQLTAMQPDNVEALATNAGKEVADIDQQLSDGERRQIELRTKVSYGGEEGLAEQRDEAQSRLDRATDEQRRIRSRANAVRVLKEEVEAARERAYASYREPLREAIVDRGAIVFGQSFNVALSDALAITSRTLDGITVAWESLSSGAREQLAVLTGIAVGSLASDGGVPLVLDDTLGYTDPSRLEALGALLGHVDDAQVIVLSCVPDRFSHIGGAHRVSLPVSVGG